MVNKILIIKLGAKGDVVRTLPILIAIKEKFPDSEITWITKSSSKGILELSPYINKILILPVDISFFNEVFDILFNFDTEDEASDLAKGIKANQKYGFFSEGGYPSAFNPSSEYYLNTLFDDELKRTNIKTYQQMMFEAAELPYKKQHHTLFIDEEGLDYAKNFVKDNQINTKNLIGIHIGSSPRWPSKSWHREKIKEFIRRIKNEGYDIILFGGPDESEKHEILVNELNSEGIKVFRNNPLNKDKEFFSLINLCDKIICGDSFALHVALALKKKTIALFFCTSPNEIEDYGLLKKIVSSKLYDFFPEKQDQYDEELTRSISTEEVINSIKSFERIGKVVNAIIKKDNRVLMIKRKGGLYSGIWAFPGGRVEKEETIGEALAREIKEEVNLTLLGIIKKISNYSYLRNEGEVEGECYLVKTTGEVMINEESEEFKWASLEELNQLNCIDEVYSEALSVLR